MAEENTKENIEEVKAEAETVTETPKKKRGRPKKPAVEKKTVKDYEDLINWKKGEAHGANWLFIELCAGDLMNEAEAGVKNLKTVCNAMLDTMLEGDRFIVTPEKKNCVGSELKIRYYCDNLSPERRKYSEVN